MRHKVLMVLGGTAALLVGLNFGMELYEPNKLTSSEEAASYTSSILTPSRSVRKWEPTALESEFSQSAVRLSGLTEESTVVSPPPAPVAKSVTPKSPAAATESKPAASVKPAVVSPPAPVAKSVTPKSPAAATESKPAASVKPAVVSPPAPVAKSVTPKSPAAATESKPAAITKPAVVSPPAPVAKPVTPKSLAAATESKPAASAKPAVVSPPAPVAKPVTPKSPAAATESKPAASAKPAVVSPPAEPVRVLTPAQSNNTVEKPTITPAKEVELAEDSSSVERESLDLLRAQTGELFHLDLPERGWVLISDIRGRIQILERTLLANEGTRYTLRAIESGEYRLEFSRQQPTAYERKVVQLSITTNQGLNIEPQRTTLIEPSLEERALTLEAYILQSTSAQEIIQEATRIQAEKMTLNAKELKHAFDLLWQGRVYTLLATELGEAYVLRFKEDLVSAEVLYRLGSMYESGGQERNLRRSYQYYREVFDGYPITPYSRMSKERMDYLDRFFFHIQ